MSMIENNVIVLKNILKQTQIIRNSPALFGSTRGTTIKRLKVISTQRKQKLPRLLWFKLVDFVESWQNLLKAQSCKLYNNKYVIASSIEITNTEIFTFIALPFFKLFSRKVLFINRKKQ